jgi:glutamine cyclotransferase
MTEKLPRLSRRSLLAATALSALGSGTAVAKLQSSSESGRQSVATDELSWDDTAWPQSKHDNGNTNYNGDASPPTTELTVAWEKENFVQDFVVADGRIYYSTSSETTVTIHALDVNDGADAWSTDVASKEEGEYLTVDSEALVVAGGMVYCSTYEETIVLDAEDGSEQWRVDAGGGQMKVTDDFIILTGDRVTALSREDGTVQWGRDVDFGGEFAVVDGLVYIPSGGIGGKNVRAVRLDDGADVWTRSFESDEYGFVVATDSQVYYWHSNRFYTLDSETGDTLWTKYGGELGRAEAENVGVIAASDDVLYAGFDEVYGAYDAETGEAQWTTESTWNTSRATVAGDAMYYTRFNSVGEPESVVVRSLDGDVVADHRLAGVSGKVITTESALYVGTDDDRLLALQEPTEGDGSRDDGSEDSDDSERSDGGNTSDGGSDDSDGSDETTDPDVDDDC